ncbi:MAG: hypothetical protein GY754_37935 [bacterium]|nr:hypothetical protein [bacterium]
MRVRVKITALLVLGSLLFGAAFAAAETELPTSDDVKRELGKLLTPKKNVKKTEDSSFDWNFDLSGIIDFMRMIRTPLIIALITGLAILIFFLVRKLRPYVNDSIPLGKETGEDENAAQRKRELLPFEKLYNEAVKSAEQGACNEAVLLLHMASVSYLQEKVIISRTTEYTNNDLKRKLRKKEQLFAPFCLISRFAEIAAFSEQTIAKEECASALENFKQGFLE